MCRAAPSSSSSWQRGMSGGGHVSRSQRTHTCSDVLLPPLPFTMSSKHANVRSSGAEREKKIKGAAICALIFMLIASKYAMNVLVFTTQFLPDIKMPRWQYWGSSCERRLHAGNTKSLLSKDNAPLQGSRKNWLPLPSVQSAVPLHSRRLLGHAAGALPSGTGFKQPYLIRKI